MPRPSNREKILDAYVAVIIEHGGGAATLDAVCERAGLSKGGLLYHFGSKADLQAGLHLRLSDSIDELNAEAPEDVAELVRWYLTSVNTTEAEDGALWRSLIASIHTGESADTGDDGTGLSLPDLVARYSRPLDRLEPVLAHTVRLVADGIYLNLLVGGAPLAAPILDAIIDGLVHQPRDQPSEPGP